jgi:hypothetical protein
MPIDKSIKSNRLLQSKRYTQQQLGDAQEAFTSVLDINAGEVYTQQNLIPTSSLPYSGSSQNGQYVTSGGSNILKFYYRQRLTPSDTLDTGSYNTWFFLDPTASIDYTNGVNAGVLNTRQQGNFISPKYAPALGGNTENSPAGYQVKLTDSTGAIIDPATYTFDYKDGVLQFNGSSGYSSISTILTLTAYQYVGRTVASNDTLGYSGSFSGSFSGGLIGTSSWANNATTSSYALTSSYAPNFNVSGNLFVGGDITAQTLHVQSITSSTEYVTGSTIFGSLLTDTHLLTGSTSVTGAFFVNNYQFYPNLIATGSITASIDVDINNLFLIKSGSAQYLNISSSSNTTLYSNLFIVKNFTTQQPVLTVSQSVVQFATQSFNPTGITTAGSIWFTSSSMYIGLEN